MVSQTEVPRRRTVQQAGGGDALLAGGPQPVPPSGLGATERRVVAHEELDAEDPEEGQEEDHLGHGGGSLQIAARDLVVDVEDQRSVLDLLRSVPTEEVEHDRIGARPLEAVVLDDPTAEHARVVLDGGDDGESAIEPPALEP